MAAAPMAPAPLEYLQHAQKLLSSILLQHTCHPMLWATRTRLFESMLGYRGSQYYPLIGIGISQPETGPAVLEFLTTAEDFELNIPRLFEMLGLGFCPFHVWSTGEAYASGRPAYGGDSIGHHGGDTGTLGCVVRDKMGQDLILGCNHVLAKSNTAALGDTIWQPGSLDGGHSTDKIGTLHSFKAIAMGGSIGNDIDAALCCPGNASDVTAQIRTLGKLSGYDPAPAFRIDVEKHGWKTAHTNGVLQIQRLSLLVTFPSAQVALFDNQLGIVGKTAARFAEPGDSGAIVVNTARKAIGMIISTFNGVNLTIACPIEPVLQHFDVALQ